ncbi:polysaccharide deacetylase family protein [candidate division KSB1 bacterium]|nr:polysaccharide deacetylase family protein [candidate division KSB1 bacterium]
MTTFIPAYDTESAACFAALHTIVEIHHKYGLPATFFLVAQLLDSQGDEYRRHIGDHPLFEIASHSYTHLLLREHRLCGAPGPKDKYEREIVHSKQRLEDFFCREVSGFRTPVGFSDGLCGAPELLSLCHQAGYRYSSSLAWGPQETVPALIREPFTYREQGYPDFWELPPCGWHDNLLKGNNAWDPQPLQLFPHPMPEAAATRFIETPEEEFAMNRVFIDKAIEMGAKHVSLIWHPWSLKRFDPAMKMLELTFSYVRERGLPVLSFAEFLKMVG